MRQPLATRMRDVYSGEAGRVWARIEREAPGSYWEENAVLGRQDTLAALLEWLGPLTGKRILDAGCGRGLLTRSLAGEGAMMTGVDLVSDHVSEARRRGNGTGQNYAVADFRDLVSSEPPFDVVVLQEVLEEYGPDELTETLKALGRGTAGRLVLIFRQPGPWRGLIAPMLPAPLVPTLDPVPLFRSIHLHTPYRLARQESIRRRSYSVRMVDFTLQVDFGSSNQY